LAIQKPLVSGREQENHTCRRVKAGGGFTAEEKTGAAGLSGRESRLIKQLGAEG
jgi:hypothetical protein